jgi:hypothetical protein
MYLIFVGRRSAMLESILTLIEWLHLITLATNAIQGHESGNTMSVSCAMDRGYQMSHETQERSRQHHYLMPMMATKITKTLGAKTQTAIGAKHAIMIITITRYQMIPAKMTIIIA